MTALHPKIPAALISMDFLSRSRALSRRFSPQRTPAAERLIYLDGEEVLEMIAALGHIPRFNAREKFFHIGKDKAGDFSFGFHILLRDGRAELVWVVREKDELLLGSPWSVYPKRMGAEPIPAPVFGSYEDLEEILQTAFGMYEDFKKAVLSAE